MTRFFNRFNADFKAVTNRVLAALLLTVCASQVSGETETPLDHLLASIEQVRKQHAISAVGLAIIADGKTIWTGGLGTLGHGIAKPVTDTSIFRIGSITKSFTSLAILRAAEQDKLTLQDPIHQWIPKAWFHNPWQATHPITVHHLLEHTAGFKDISEAEFDFNRPGNIPLDSTLQEFKAQHIAAWPAGEHSSYSNLGAAFAGLILEKVNDAAYEKVIETTLFKPLGMADSNFFLTPQQYHALAKGYDTDGVTPIPYWNMVYRPFGGINSTPQNMAHYIEMLLANGKHPGKAIVAPSSIKALETPSTTFAARSGLTFGYSMGIYQWLYKGILFYGHGGDADGYLSHVGYTRENNSGYFVVINAFNGKALRELRKLIQDYLITGLTTPKPAKTFTLDPASAIKISGLYQQTISRFGKSNRTMRILYEAGRLYTQINNGRKVPLIPLSSRHFRRANQPIATIAITESENGTLYFQDEALNFKKVSP